MRQLRSPKDSVSGMLLTVTMGKDREVLGLGREAGAVLSMQEIRWMCLEKVFLPLFLLQGK